MLNRSAIAGDDAEPGRQAVVAWMVDFAGRGESALIAKSVETVAKRATLLALRVSQVCG